VAKDDPGLLIILSAPSGAGKTTLAREFLARHQDAAFSVSATTRAPRGAEQDGVDYHFVSPERFEALVREGAFAEWAHVHGERYGTLKATVEDALARRRLALFDIDVKGGSALKAHYPRAAVAVFVLPPSLDELERRLRARSTDGEASIRRRLAAARSEIAFGARSYDYFIVNDDLGRAGEELDLVVADARARNVGEGSSALAGKAEALSRGQVDLRPWL
jgi:guanylate kinase